jgi:hypothetical protein
MERLTGGKDCRVKPRQILQGLIPWQPIATQAAADSNALVASGTVPGIRSRMFPDGNGCGTIRCRFPPAARLEGVGSG